MDLHKAHWGKTLAWGFVTGVLYALLFFYSSELLHLAHTTPDACVVEQAGRLTYLHHPTPEACAAQGGSYSEGHWARALLPILVAFAISYAHGAFTGLFWDSMGLKAASKH